MKITKTPTQLEKVMQAPTAGIPKRKPEEVATQTKVVLDSFQNYEEPPDEDFVRVPFGSAGLQLSATEIPGYHLHWINDWHPSMANRIQQAQRAGYKFVSQQEVDTAQLLGADTADLSGERVSRLVGTKPNGEPLTAYLMKIPTAWWVEHQKAGWDHADKVDAAIRRGAAGAKVESGYNPASDPIKLTTKLQQGVNPLDAKD
jgi:hypothetical protein